MSISRCPKHGIPDCSPLLNGCSWRPPPWPDEPSEIPGHVRRWTIAPDRWQLVVEPRRCRMQVDRRHHVCGEPAVAELNRGRKVAGERCDSWWAYCGEHLYGRRIADGRVWQLVLVDASVDSP